MTNITTIKKRPPAEMVTLANAIVGIERTTLENVAALGRLVTAAAEANIASGFSAPRAQTFFDEIERVSAAQFEQMKAISATHRKLSAAGETIMGSDSGSPWGPDESCMILKLSALAERRVA